MSNNHTDATEGSEMNILDLPEDVVGEMLGFLDARQVAKVGGTCKQLHESCSSHTLWKRLYLQDFFQSSFKDLLKLRFGSAKEYYVSRYVERLNHIRAAVESYNEATRVRDLRIRQQRLKSGLIVFNTKVLCLPGVVLLAFVSFLSMKLDNKIDWDWWYIFSPFGVLIACIFASITCACCLCACKDRDMEESVFGMQYQRSEALPTIILREALRDRVGGASYICFMLLLLVTQLAFLVLKVSGEVAWPFWLVFMPIYCFLLFFLAMPFCVASITSDDRTAFLVVTGIGYIPLLSFVVLLTLYLDGVIGSIQIMLIPCWVVDSLMVLGYLMVIALVIKKWREDNMNQVREGLLGLLGSLFISGPWIAFEILLTLQKNGVDLQYRTIFIPLFCWLGLGAVGLCILSAVFLQESWRDNNYPIPPPQE